MSRVVVDPVTRIEGHLRIEAQIDEGVVRDAWSSSTMFRGIERILQGRDPRDAWIYTQRICGVCTTVHAVAAVRAVEDAIGAEPPPNARILRNLIMASQSVQDHVIHFYHLHALDWVDVVSALSADPAATAQLAQSISDWPKSSPTYFAGVRDRVRAFVDRGQLGPFGHAYWGHPAYRLPPEANLMAVAHYLEALDWQREFIRIHAVLGGKNPHLQSFLVGGMATPVDPNRQTAINAGTLAQLEGFVRMARDFVDRVYVPDVLAIAPFYSDWTRIGAGPKSFLSYGDFPEADGPRAPTFIPSGVIRLGQIGQVERFDAAKVTEEVTHSWYEYEGSRRALHPYDGQTEPRYTGPTPPFEHLDVDGEYSWIKSPRYDGWPMEVGPLARMVIAYASGHTRVKELVGGVLTKLGVGPEALFSTLGRIAARAIETKLLAEKMGEWVNELAANMDRGDLRIHDSEHWDPSSWPRTARGAGLHEAPRGALGHWVQIENGLIKRYQCVVPSTWNAGPRDASGARGPYEASLVGTPVVDPAQPVEILRTIHSFDPCMACAVHVVDPTRRQIVRVRAS